jgi:hypothetical protein
MSNKKIRGQFYTTNYEYILEGLPQPPSNIRCIIEPFAGKGDLLNWIKADLPIEAYDIEPKRSDIITRDTLLYPPNYTDAWVITNPPYLARNKNDNKEIYEKYETNDLYKCFLNSLVDCSGGILIIPSGFFLSPRDIDVRCRHNFMKQYRILKVKYFEQQVFEDTSTTVVAFAFEKSNHELTEQDVEWEHLPSKETRNFTMKAEYGWIVGGEIYNLKGNVKVRRHIEGQPLKENEQQTFMTLHALDTGMMNGRISMIYHEGYVYPAKDCSRATATLRVQGMVLSEEEQKELCDKFNEFIEQKREETWSLFLPQYRESKEYARKRIPFELAYLIVSYLLSS